MLHLQQLQKNLVHFEKAITQNTKSNASKADIDSKIDNFYILITNAIEENQHKFKTQSQTDLVAPHQQTDTDCQEPIIFDWSPDDKFRAKLYQLDADGRWQDLGTGYFSIESKGHE